MPTKPIALDETLKEVAAAQKNTAEKLNECAKDTTLQELAKSLGNKDALLLRIAEALDAKDVTQDRIQDINDAADAKKNSVLGEIPDEYTAMSKKVNFLQNTLIGTADGEIVRLDDVSPVEHIMRVMLRSENMIPYPYAMSSKTENGVTFTDNGDGTITISGTATGNINYSLYLNTKSKIPVNGKYTLFCTSEGGWNTLYVQPYIDGVSQDIQTSSPVTYEWHGELTALSVQIRNGTVFGEEGITVKPMLVKGDKIGNYKPFVDPSQAKLIKWGKNILDPVFKTQLWVDTPSGSVISNNTNGYSQIVPVKPNTTYTLSGKFTGANSNYIRVAFLEEYPAPGVVTVAERINNTESTPVKAFTTPSNCHYLLLATGTSTKYDYTSNRVMIEKGEVATPYEAYEETTYMASVGTKELPHGTVEGVVLTNPDTCEYNHRSHTVTLMSDTENVVIDGEYNRDINKAFSELTEKLTNAIISLGGNV